MRISRRSVLWAALLAIVLGPGSLPAGHAKGYDADDLQRDLDAIGALGATRVHAQLTVGAGEPLVAVSGSDTEGAGGPTFEFYFIGSNAETFVATVVLQLVGEGRLSLDDAVETHLPGLVRGSRDGAAITIRQLLQHTSGIADYTLEPATSPEASPEAQVAPADLVGIAMGQPAAFAPGRAWGYSHTDYLLAGMIIEAVAGNPWDHEVRTRIIEPLGLAQTTEGANPENPDLGWSRADGGLMSTAENMTTFFDALLGGELLAPEQLAAMREAVETNRGDGSRYGLGMEWRPLSCGGGYWGQRSTVPAYRSEVGVSEDGVRRMVVSNATVSVDAAADRAQEESSLALVDRALCGGG